MRSVSTVTVTSGAELHQARRMRHPLISLSVHQDHSEQERLVWLAPS